MSLKDNYDLPDKPTEFNAYKLEKKTKEIKKEYVKFLGELLKHMKNLQENGIIDFSVITTEITMYDRKLESAMDHCKSLPDVFKIISLPEHSSFLDYDLIKLLLDKYGSEKVKELFIEYKKKLQKFLEARIFAGEDDCLVVLIDQIISVNNPDWNRLQNRIKNILGVKEKLTLQRCEDLNQYTPALVHHEENVTATSVSSSQSNDPTNIWQSNTSATTPPNITTSQKCITSQIVTSAIATTSSSVSQSVSTNTSLSIASPSIISLPSAPAQNDDTSQSETKLNSTLHGSLQCPNDISLSGNSKLINNI